MTGIIDIRNMSQDMRKKGVKAEALLLISCLRYR